MGCRTTDSPVITTVFEDGVLTVTMDRPERKNALDLGMVRDFRAAISEAGDSLRVLVLRSALEGYFSVGMDLAALEAGVGEGATSPQVYESVKEYIGLLKDLVHLRAPSIAVVGGLAVGGGVDLLAACDMAVASNKSAFSIAQLRKGIFPLTTSGVTVPLIGERRFTYWALSGQNYSARKALRIGLLSEVVPAQKLGRVVDGLVKRIKGFDHNALHLGIDAMRHRPAKGERLEYLGGLLTLTCQIPRGGSS